MPQALMYSVRCYIAKKRKISVGDKMAGRHVGTRGYLANTARRGYAFMEDGTPLEVVLNPLCSFTYEYRTGAGSSRGLQQKKDGL